MSEANLIRYFKITLFIYVSLFFQSTLSSESIFIVWLFSKKGTLLKIGEPVALNINDLTNYDTILNQVTKSNRDKLKTLNGLLQKSNQDCFAADIVDIDFNSFQNNQQGLQQWLHELPVIRCVVDFKEKDIPFSRRKLAWSAWQSVYNNVVEVRNYIGSLFEKK